MGTKRLNSTPRITGAWSVSHMRHEVSSYVRVYVRIVSSFYTVISECKLGDGSIPKSYYNSGYPALGCSNLPKNSVSHGRLQVGVCTTVLRSCSHNTTKKLLFLH